MVALTRDKNGAWHARKRIPNAVRDEFHHLYGQRHEAKFFAEGTTPDREARQLFNEWLAEMLPSRSCVRHSERTSYADFSGGPRSSTNRFSTTC